MRLIDKDELMKQLGMYESCRECVSVSSVSTNLPLCTKYHDFSLACGAISDAPIIDAVQVVRCKDCANRVLSQYDSDEYDEYVDWCGISGLETDDDDFCSCGERRRR